MAERMTLTEEKSFKVTQLFGGGHRGTDLNINPRGIAKPPILLPEKAVRAVVDVVDTGSIEPSYGNWIQLTVLEGKYKGYWMRACHMLAKSHLKKGDMVKAGDLIGYQGNTGRSFGAHVHFELGKPSKEFIPWSTAYLIAPYDILGCPAKVGTYQNDYAVNPKNNNPVQPDNKEENDMKAGIYTPSDKAVSSQLLKEGAFALMQPDGKLKLYTRRIAREVTDATLSSTYETLRDKEMRPGEIVAVTEG